MNILARQLGLTTADVLVDYAAFEQAAKEILLKPDNLPKAYVRRYKIAIEAFFDKGNLFERDVLTPFYKIANHAHVTGHDGTHGLPVLSEDQWVDHVKTNGFKVNLSILQDALQSVADNNDPSSTKHQALPQPTRLEISDRRQIAYTLLRQLGLKVAR